MEPASPQIRPSTMNGPRTNQLVAPTSFITSISRRRAKIESRIVLAISSVEAIRSRSTPIRQTTEMIPPTLSTRCEVVPPSLTSSTPGGAGRSWARISLMYSPFVGVISYASGYGL